MSGAREVCALCGADLDEEACDCRPREPQRVSNLVDVVLTAAAMGGADDPANLARARAALAERES